MRRKAGVLSAIAIYTFLLTPLSPLLAEESNNISTATPSKIQHEPRPVPALAGKSLEIEAVINADVAVQRVTIYYRTKGEEKYQNKPMQRNNKSYMAEIPGDAVSFPAIEYYILVVDLAGKIEASRSAQSPYIIPVVDNPEEKLKANSNSVTGNEISDIGSPIQSSAPLSSVSASPAWYSSWWVWTVAGALVTGTVIAFAAKRGKSDNPGGGAPAAPGPVTVTGPIP